MTRSNLREINSDRLREINEVDEVMEVRQLTSDELDLVAGGEDPDSGGQIRRLARMS